MRRALTLAAALVFLLALGYAAWLNPDHVEVHFTGRQSFRAQLGLLLASGFLAGVVVTLFGLWLRHLQRSIARWPARRTERRRSRAAAREAAGTASAWDGQLARARTLLRKAWRDAPDRLSAPLALASSHLDTDELSAARVVLQDAMTRTPHDPDLRCLLAETLRRSGDTAEAIRLLESVRVQHPHAPRALVALRDLYRSTARWAEAAHAQQAYLRLLPAPAPPPEAELLHHLRYQSALACSTPERVDLLAELVRHGASFLPAVVSLGDALVACHRANEALALWERAFRDSPCTVLFERLLAQHSTPRERQRVIALAAKQRQRIDSDSFHLIAARSALEEGDMERATGELQAVARREQPAAHRLWAEIHAHRGDFEQAWNAMQRLAESGVSGRGYDCTHCGRHAEAWTGYCPGCERWNSYRSVTELAATAV